MKEQSDRHNWWFALCVAACIGAALFPLTMSSSDFAALLYVFVTVPFVTLCLLHSAKKRKHKQRYASLSLFVLFLTFTAVIFTHFLNMRDTVRWVLRRGESKHNVLSQPTPMNGQFRHIEWEGWGFPGAGNTVTYLVFDPCNSLVSAAKLGSPGKFPGLPCEVVRVHRLEKSWYTALFYTDTDWEHCS